MRRYLSPGLPTRGMQHKAILRWVRVSCRTQHSPKYLRFRRNAPKKGHLKRQAINLTLPKRVKAVETAPLRPERSPVSSKTWPDPCRRQHGWPKCDPTTGEAHQTRGFGRRQRIYHNGLKKGETFILIYDLVANFNG